MSQTNKCQYTNRIMECTHPIDVVCELCLRGQIADNISLQTSAIMALTAGIEELIAEIRIEQE